MRLDLRDGEALGRSRQTHRDVARQHLALLVAETLESTRRLRPNVLSEILGRALALQDVDVEHREIVDVEAHRRAAAGDRVAELRARPVEHRHEVVADDLKASARDIFEPVGDNRLLEILAPKDIARFIARKGSVAVNGTSLTTNDVNGQVFTINLIPHTLENTTLHLLKPGAKVNLEVDLIARYCERLLAAEREA